MSETGQTTPRVAVVGAGRWGRNHIRNYAELGALAAIVDRNAGGAAELAATYGARALSFEEALADSAIDGMVLALPPSQNHALGSRALEAGKHLFVEKPMAMTTAEAADLCSLAEARDRRLMVGHILQYHPAFLALADLVRVGRLGRLLSIVSTRLDFGRIRREEDVLWALAPHDVSMVLALAGAVPSRVSATGGCHTHPTIADTAALDLGFASGLRAEIRVSWLHPFKEQRLVVVGETGMAVFDDREPWQRKLVLHGHRVVAENGVVVAQRGEEDRIALVSAEPLREECRHFLHCIETGARPRTYGREGEQVLAVLERASVALDASRRLPSPAPFNGSPISA